MTNQRLPTTVKIITKVNIPLKEKMFLNLFTAQNTPATIKKIKRATGPLVMTPNPTESPARATYLSFSFPANLLKTYS